ncbi:MAG: helix-turn-helix domain-containing protein [SAR324 cluster bacterium]|uniref:Helix-turn-helix domain-containing protein n=1 Tax=SAR324 cluster bacterium TaxID=2024889 RepID=A0A7X9IMK1_9DELT|nr:helix-turn-helix domain-containing protein [SAR324 cluster bacterium]
MEYITAKEAAEKWGISQRRVQLLCEQGRVVGAVRLGWAWAIPKEADKPADARTKAKGKI